MKNYLLIAPLLLMLGACGGDEPTPASEDRESVRVDADAADSSTEAAGAPVSEDAGGHGDPARARLEQFAEQLVADDKGHFRYNRIRDAKDGGKERQVYAELFAMTDVEAADRAAAILNNLGYKPGRRWSDENGVRMRFVDVGDIPVDVLVRSREAHPLLEKEESTASVYLTRRIGTR